MIKFIVLDFLYMKIKTYFYSTAPCFRYICSHHIQIKPSRLTNLYLNWLVLLPISFNYNLCGQFIIDDIFSLLLTMRQDKDEKAGRASYG